MKYKTQKQWNSGFTLVETLIAVGILMVLLAVGIVAAAHYARWLRITELDNAAREIYLAAENRAVLLNAGGRLERSVRDAAGQPVAAPLSEGESGDLPAGALYYLYYDKSGAADTDGGAALEDLLPEGSIDPALREGCFYMVYDIGSGSATDVFYAEEGELLEPDGSFEEFYASWRNTSRAFRLDAGRMIGCYSGDAADAGEQAVPLSAPGLEIVNQEELLVRLAFRVPLGVTRTPVVRLRYHETTVPLAPGLPETTVSGGAVTYTYTWVLDTLEENGPHFAELFRNTADRPASFGGDFSVEAELLQGGDVSPTVRAEDNSLFAKGSGGETAYIANLRHLQNLDEGYSGVTSKRAAEQIADIDCGAGLFPNYEFVPIENSALATYRGSHTEMGKTTVHSIRGLTVTQRSSTGKPGAGLFAAVTGEEEPWRFQDVRLINTSVSGGAVPTGALAGTAANAAFTGCWVCWEPETGQPNLRSLLGSSGAYQYPIHGAGSAGGLVGELIDSRMENCLSATLIQGGTVGGLAGSAVSAAVSVSYADCCLSGSTAGGLFGSAAGTIKLTDLYTAGFIDAERSAAGLCNGPAEGENLYTVMRYAAQTAAGITPLADLTDNSRNCSFLAVSGVSGGMTYETMVSRDGEDFAAALSKAFAWKTLGDSHPYNLLLGQELTTYDFPGIKDLPHYGDWETQFSRASLAYYEQYLSSGGSVYGFLGGGLDLLKSGEEIRAAGETVPLDGYAVVLKAEDLTGEELNLTFTWQDGAETVVQERSYRTEELLPVEREGEEYRLAPLPEELVNTRYAAPEFYQYLRVESTAGLVGAGTGVFAFNPHFAGTAVAIDSGTAPEEFSTEAAWGLAVRIRTPRHLRMLSAHREYFCNQQFLNFVQELDLDYSTYTGYDGAFDSSLPQAPIGSYASPFNSVYNGSCCTIQHVTFQITEGGDHLYAGLFGYSTGTLSNVVCLMDPDNTRKFPWNGGGSLYIGGLAGGSSGSISNCAVAGVNLACDVYKTTTVCLGGLVGQNAGMISHSAAETAALYASCNNYSAAYSGGLVGENTSAGTIAVSYAVGYVAADVDSTSQAQICGFAGSNTGVIKDCYAAANLRSSLGTAAVYGFCGDGEGTRSGTRFLNEGNFVYRNTSFNASYSAADGEGIQYQDLTAEKTDVSPINGMRMGALCRSDENRTEYPYPAAVTDGAGRPVHYGQWPERMDLGAMGVYYWERLELGDVASYDVSLLSVNPDTCTVTKQSTLSNAHSDGGVVTDYGYGYYSVNGNTVDMTAADIFYAAKEEPGTLLTAGADREDSEVNDILAGLMRGYTFHSYHSYGMETGGGGLLPQGGYTDPGHKYRTFTYPTENGSLVSLNAMDYTRKPNGAITLVQEEVSVTFTLNPHFAESLAVVLPEEGRWSAVDGASAETPGSEGNPYRVRALSQLQNINWTVRMSNGASGVVTGYATDDVVCNASNGYYGGNQYGFLYLSHDSRAAGVGGSYNNAWTERYDYHWVQTHDIDGKNGNFAPIAAFQDRKDGSGGFTAGEDHRGASGSWEDTILTAWFGGSYDGGDYAIKNINIAAADANCVGLFGVTLDATLKNIILYSDSGENTVTVSGRGSYSPLYSWYAAGGLVGLAGVSEQNKGSGQVQSISNCTVAGYTIVDATRFAGSFRIDPTIPIVVTDTSSAKQQIILDGKPKYGGGAVGGLVGICNLDLSNCTASTSIELSYTRGAGSQANSPVRVGGLAGSCVASVNNCYTGGAITVSRGCAQSGNLYVGGLVGGAGMRSIFVPYYSVSALGGTVTIANSYSTMELPPKTERPVWDSGSVINRYAAGGAGREDDDYAVVVRNCFALGTEYSRAQYDDTASGGVCLVSFRQLAGEEPIEKDGESQYIMSAESGWLTAFSPVTAAENGFAVPGKYSYTPSLYTDLQGMNYPFPTILTQGEGSIHVHYGSWPLYGIDRVHGGEPIVLNLFGAGRDTWTETLTLSADIPAGGIWAVEQEEAGTKIAQAEIGQNGVLTVTGLSLGLTEVEVSCTADGVKYSITITVYVEDALKLHLETAPVRLRAGDRVKVPVFLRGGEEERELTQNQLAYLTVDLSASRCGSIELLERAALTEEDGRYYLELTAISKLEAPQQTEPLNIQLAYQYRGVDYTDISTIYVCVVQPEPDEESSGPVSGKEER